MKAFEILREESYVDEVSSALTDLLVSAKSNGVDVVSTPKLVKALNNMGYNADDVSVMQLLQGNPLVQSATLDVVDLQGSAPGGVSGDQTSAEQNQDAVAQMAQSVVDKEL